MTSSIPNHYLPRTDDDSLAVLAQNGSKAAADVLLKRYRPLVKSIASHYFGASLETDDLLQEGMLGLLSAIYSYTQNKKASFKTYAAVCAVHRIQSAIKINSGIKNSPLNTYIPIDEIEISSDSDPEKLVISDEEADSLMSIINSELSPLEMQVLRRYITGESYTGISAVCGISEKSVDNALQRVRSKLKKALNYPRS